MNYGSEEYWRIIPQIPQHANSKALAFLMIKTEAHLSWPAIQRDRNPCPFPHSLTTRCLSALVYLWWRQSTNIANLVLWSIGGGLDLFRLLWLIDTQSVSMYSLDWHFDWAIAIEHIFQRCLWCFVLSRHQMLLLLLLLDLNWDRNIPWQSIGTT